MVTHRRLRRAAPQPGRAANLDDVNMRAAELLYDMAALQAAAQRSLGYKRAARAIAALKLPVQQVVSAGALRDIPFIGPASARIVTEFVEQGRSETVDAAVIDSPQRAVVDRQRALRRNFLSHHALQQVLESPVPRGGVRRGLYRGDFQMHSTWSDGRERIETLVEACLALGHTCLGITDHSHGLPIARGVSMEDVARQHREIDGINERYADRFRVFRGIEANILADGGLDLSLEERGVFEFVVASPHAVLRRTHDQTARMLRAVEAPGVAILGHPRGRMFNSRPGVAADWPRVFEAAARAGVAIELDGNWHRQDIDFELARVALEAGCLFALDSDAHSVAELAFSDYAIAHARLARLPASHVINCWSDEKLGRWMAQRRG